MNPLLRPEFLLRLKQGELPLEGYTFQLVAQTTSYPDDALCAFYDASLNVSCRASSSEDCPRADFAAFVEWTQARNRSSFPACSMKNLAGATPDPEPSQPPPRPAEYQPEPTDDGELKPDATSEPSQIGATEQLITTEPELHNNIQLQTRSSTSFRTPATEPEVRGGAYVLIRAAPPTLPGGVAKSGQIKGANTEDLILLSPKWSPDNGSAARDDLYIPKCPK
ncbi:RNA-splicing ligase RtcB [Labeo rohita]|uniref:RNA-splicing ligase RtcB n=1 Tax=Labeo rohita TaxID=84645 RepID=A0ABQ8LC95_LABRO|nr:RNA-splicing ligase RtcB [Labeo rohita]